MCCGLTQHPNTGICCMICCLIRPPHRPFCRFKTGQESEAESDPELTRDTKTAQRFYQAKLRKFLRHFWNRILNSWKEIQGRNEHIRAIKYIQTFATNPMNHEIKEGKLCILCNYYLYKDVILTKVKCKIRCKNCNSVI